MNSIGSQSSNLFRQVSTSEQNLVRSRSRRDLFVAFRTTCCDDSRSCLVRELYSTSSNRTSTTLHKNGFSTDRTSDVNRPMSRYAGNAETGTLFQRHAFGYQYSALL